MDIPGFSGSDTPPVNQNELVLIKALFLLTIMHTFNGTIKESSTNFSVAEGASMCTATGPTKSGINP